MRWACIVLSMNMAGCSDSLAPGPRAAPTAGKIVLSEDKTVAPSPNQPAADPDLAATIEGTSGEIDSAQAKAHPNRAKAMLAAAKKTLEGTKASYELGETTLANLHLWSRNVLLAQRALAQTKEEELSALVDYWKRSRQTHLKVRALYNTGSRGGEAEQFATATYYLAEAELWLEAAGGTVPEDVD
jgi:hypothetical protein